MAVSSRPHSIRSCVQVFTIVGTPADVESVTLGPEGVLASLKPGGLLVEMTTSTPSLAVTIADKAAAAGCLAIDAPVSGGDVGAKAGTLSIMCGGTDEAMSTAAPYLELMGKTIKHMGGPGAGQHTKMCNQILACNNMIGMTESLLCALHTAAAAAAAAAFSVAVAVSLVVDLLPCLLLTCVVVYSLFFFASC